MDETKRKCRKYAVEFQTQHIAHARFPTLCNYHYANANLLVYVGPSDVYVCQNFLEDSHRFKLLEQLTPLQNF